MSCTLLYTNSCTSGFDRSSTSCRRKRICSRPGCWITQSGCFSNSSLWGVTISGSTQIPNLISLSVHCFTSHPSPLGSFSLFTTQSPSPASSLLRGCFCPNHPSSSRKSSKPIPAASSIIDFSLGSLKLK